MPFHSYVFFDALPSITILSEQALRHCQEAFALCIGDATDMRIQPYATLALTPGTRFLLHLNAETPDRVQRLVRDLLHTSLGAHLRVAYTLRGLTRASEYNPMHPPKEHEDGVPHRYLVVYPFTKTVEWHLLPYEERRTIMKAHVDVARKYSDDIAQLLLYAFGVDDHEFIVSYQMDSLQTFQALVMELRNTEARRYTKNDLPICMGIHIPLNEVLSML